MSLGPAALTASLPRALGRAPAEELVLVGVSDLSAGAAGLYSVDLSGLMGEDDAEDAAQAVYEAVHAAARDGATRVAVVVYDEHALSIDSTAARFAATAVVAAEAAGLAVLDALAVFDGRWRSYECTNAACCPPEGTPIQGQS